MTPDVNRGELRLAAEVALAKRHGIKVPFDAELRATEILNTLANG